jgi:hypothetical protein
VYVHLGNNPINLFNLQDHLFKKNYDEKARPPSPADLQTLTLIKLIVFLYLDMLLIVLNLLVIDI